MGYYFQHEISTCEIAGAVAAAALEDLRVNFFAFPGFPEISVVPSSASEFRITLSLTARNAKRIEIGFILSRQEAFRVARRRKKQITHDPSIFKTVQNALAELEGMYREKERH